MELYARADNEIAEGAFGNEKNGPGKCARRA